MKRFIWI